MPIPYNAFYILCVRAHVHLRKSTWPNRYVYAITGLSFSSPEFYFILFLLLETLILGVRLYFSRSN